jgi:rhodanese-related sulfurtransferase
MKHSQGALLVDSMNPKTYAKYHILGAINLPTDSEANRKRWSSAISFPKNIEIIVYCDCAGEGTAIGAARILKAKGYKNVMVVKGGFDALTKVFPLIWEGKVHFPGDRKPR